MVTEQTPSISFTSADGSVISSSSFVRKAVIIELVSLMKMDDQSE
jgi:hypothetical protein